MKKSFPKSYPYFNKHGVAFTKESLNLIGKYFINRRKPISLEFGIEICYILLWSMERATDTLHFIKLTSYFFKKMVRRRQKRPVGTNSDVLERILDPASYHIETDILKKVDIDRIVGDENRIQELVQMRSRDRYKEIEKLKKQWEGA